MVNKKRLARTKLKLVLKKLGIASANKITTMEMLEQIDDALSMRSAWPEDNTMDLEEFVDSMMRNKI